VNVRQTIERLNLALDDLTPTEEQQVAYNYLARQVHMLTDWLDQLDEYAQTAARAEMHKQLMELLFKN
jgi:hypothetical protein